MKKINLVYIILALFLLIAIPVSVKAINWQNEENIIISEGETVDGNLYFFSEEVVVDGNVNGDLIGVTNNLTVNGRVEGDVLAIVQNLNFTGEVVGNIRLIGNEVNIKGSIGRNLNLIGTNVFLSNNNKINWDALILANNLDMRGEIAGNLYGLTNSSFLNGEIKRDVNIIIRNKEEGLVLGESLKIGNNLFYRSANKANTSPEASIAGDTEFKELAKKNVYQFIWSLIYGIFSAILIGLLLIHLFKKPFRQSSENIYQKPFLSLAWGTLFVIILPIILIILAFTVIGLQLALILLFIWLAIILSSKVIFAYFVGRLLFNKIIKKPKTQAIWKMIFGIIIAWILFSLPFIGSFLLFLATLLGFGSFFLYLKNLNQS